jgi:hypothetical protein
MPVGSTDITFIVLPHIAQANESGGVVANGNNDAGMRAPWIFWGATVAVLGAGLELISRGLSERALASERALRCRWCQPRLRFSDPLPLGSIRFLSRVVALNISLRGGWCACHGV